MALSQERWHGGLFLVGCCAALPPAARRRGCCAADTLVPRRVFPGFWDSSRGGPPSPQTCGGAVAGATRHHVRDGSCAVRDGNSKARRFCSQLSRDTTVGASSVDLRRIIKK